MDSWLKFRAKTPLIGSRTPTVPSTPSLDNETNPFEYLHTTEDESRLRSSSRVSSFLNLGKLNTPATDSSSFPSPSFGHENQILDGRAAQDVWHNPNQDQIAETLKVAMMTRGNFAPVPVEYNSNILHVLEAYWVQSQEIKRKDKELMELKAQLNEQMDQVEQLGEEWSAKEKQYQTELKNLEVMVANGVAGLEAVTLARSRSVLDRSNSKIEERIRQIREGSDSSKTRRGQKMTSSTSEDKEVTLSRMFMERRRRRTERHTSEHLKFIKDHPSEAAVVRKEPNEHINQQESTSSAQYPAGVDDDSSSTSDDNDCAKQSTFPSSVISPNSVSKPYPSSAVASNDESKPLPDIPLADSSETTRNEEESLQKSRVQSHSHNRTLSFVPGDDSLGVRGQQPQLLAKHFEFRDDAKLKREDSNGSATTAIRDRPAKNMAENGLGSGGEKRPDAAVAAARAMAVRQQGGS